MWQKHEPWPLGRWVAAGGHTSVSSSGGWPRQLFTVLQPNIGEKWGQYLNIVSMGNICWMKCNVFGCFLKKKTALNEEICLIKVTSKKIGLQ